MKEYWLDEDSFVNRPCILEDDDVFEDEQEEEEEE